MHTTGRVLGYQRGLRAQHTNFTLLQLEGVTTKKAADFYVGKRVAYTYKVKAKEGQPNLRVVWGKIARIHGAKGVVRARFRRNLPPSSFGKLVRVVCLILSEP